MRTSPGTGYTDAVMEHTGTPTAFYKSKLTWNTTRPGWDLTFRDGTVYQFTTMGSPGPFLVGIRDRLGNQLTLTRAGSYNQRIGRITSPSGRWVEFTYVSPTNDAVAQIQDHSGRTVSYTYDGLRLFRVTDPAGGQTEYTWDTPTNRLLTLKDARGDRLPHQRVRRGGADQPPDPGRRDHVSVRLHARPKRQDHPDRRDGSPGQPLDGRRGTHPPESRRHFPRDLHRAKLVLYPLG